MRTLRFRALTAVAACIAVALAPTLTSGGALRAVRPTWQALVAPAPSWYTSELRAQVVAAGVRGVAVPEGVSVPASSLVFLGIRPGQLILLEGGSLCTSNFVFTNGSQYFIGTAGHCGEVGEQVTMLYLPGVLVDIGTVVFSTHEPDPDDPGTDFALIAIHPELNSDVSPSLAYWGGPTEVFTGDGPQVVLHAGWGLVIGTGGTPRAGVGIEWTNTWWRFEGAITPGDSGSGAIVAGGPAAGNITHIAISTAQFPITTAAGTSMTRIMEILGPGYQLATCAAIPWPLTGCP